MLTKTLSVAKPGYLGRKLVKNTENIIVANNRYICKTNAIYQDIFGLDGFNVSSLSDFRIPMFYASETEFVDWFNDKLPKSLDITTIKHKNADISKVQFLNMIQAHTKDISKVLNQTKKYLCRL